MPITTNIAEAMTDNEALRSLLFEIRDLNARLCGKYGSMASMRDRPCSDVVSYTRGALSNALKTLVINQGANTVLVYEDNHLVAHLESGKTWVSPLSGKGEIKCRCKTGQSSTVGITTYLL